MKIKLLGITGAVFVLALSGCGGKEVEECVFPDATDVEAPGWVCDQPVKDYDITAVGSADKSGAGHDFMKQMAATSARTQLAQRMKVRVTNMIKQYAGTTGAGDSETVDLVNESVTKQITDETLMGSKILKTRMSPTGRLYVLVGMDEESVQQATQNALRTSMNNDKALWQKFQADKGFDELSEEISKLRP